MKNEKCKIPLESLFAEEVALAQGPNILFLRGVGLLDGHSHLTSTYYEECISSRSLPDYIVTIVVESLEAKSRY
jgi:hypothetical protein